MKLLIILYWIGAVIAFRWAIKRMSTGKEDKIADIIMGVVALSVSLTWPIVLVIVVLANCLGYLVRKCK